MKNILITFLILIGTFHANASTVQQVTMEEMAEKSAVVFEGTVIAVTAHRDDRGSIVTDVLFDVTDVIKGKVTGTQLKLVFLGGTFEGKTMLITDTHYPALGEKGIYFVESVDIPMVNPLFGWDQGRFLLKEDQLGEERVLTADKKPVESLDEVQPETTMQNKSNEKVKGNLTLSTGVAKGVSLKQESSIRVGISKDQFKEEVRSLVESGK
jgi:hypothetical protein